MTLGYISTYLNDNATQNDPYERTLRDKVLLFTLNLAKRVVISSSYDMELKVIIALIWNIYYT